MKKHKWRGYIHMKKKSLVRTLGMSMTALAAAAAITVSGIQSEASSSYLKAATYVSDAWVSNFWNSMRNWHRLRQMGSTALCW